MRIIKSGTREDLVQRFTCYFCGCVFEADKDEYWSDKSIVLSSYPAQHHLYTCCPECRKVISTSATVIADDYKINLTTEKLYDLNTKLSKDEVNGRHVKRSDNQQRRITEYNNNYSK